MANSDFLKVNTYMCGLRSKSGSKSQHDIINRLRNLLIDLSTEALRDMNLGRNQRAKRLLTLLSEIDCRENDNMFDI